MEELNILEKLEKVKAPLDFEQKVLTLLTTRKEKKQLMIKNLRLSFAGSFAFLVVFFILLNVFVLQKKGPLDFADLEKGIQTNFQKKGPNARGYIPIIEVVDYSKEIQSLSYEPQTIYILEQVSEEIKGNIKY